MRIVVTYFGVYRKSKNFLQIEGKGFILERKIITDGTFNQYSSYPYKNDYLLEERYLLTGNFPTEETLQPPHEQAGSFVQEMRLDPHGFGEVLKIENLFATKGTNQGDRDPWISYLPCPNRKMSVVKRETWGKSKRNFAK